MNLPLKIALYFIYFEGLAIPLFLVMAIYPMNRNADLFLKLLPFPLLAIAAMILIARAARRTTRRKLFLTLAAVASVPPAAMIVLTIDNFLPGSGVIGLFPAVMLLEEAHCAERRRRRTLIDAASARRGRRR